MKYLQKVKGCTKIDKFQNEDIRTDLGISRLPVKNMEYKTMGGCL